jgi:hypothetical protein
MKVYVRNRDGTPLMPCTPAKARKLLRDGKAKVVERSPFTIQLLWDCEGHVQEVTLGIDKGSHVTGIAYEELEGFRKGDVVQVKGKWIKQINAIYGDGRLAFKRVKGQPSAARPKDCQLLERGRTIVWERVG